MKCIIIEDELKTAEYLEELLSKIDGQIKVVARIDTVAESVKWLKANSTDLIFLDIHLGDGIGFEIFRHIRINTPVIFTTSYDEYAISSFQVNSLAYLVKPVYKVELETAIEKYKQLYPDIPDYSSLKLPGTDSYQKRFLVSNVNYLLFINTPDIAYFYVENKHVFLVARDGNQYLFDHSLENIECILDPERFFRINRQFVINLDAIGKIYFHDNKGRLKVEVIPKYKDDVLVSIEKTTSFKNWLNR